jgi:hypothetical protein
MNSLDALKCRIQFPKMKPCRLITLLFVWFALMLLAARSWAQQPDFNETMRKCWSNTDVLKRHIKGFDSPDGKLALFEFNPGDTTFSVTVLASADGNTFYRVLPLPSPNMIDDPSQKKSFSQVVSIRWSPDSKHIAVHDSLNKHSKVSIFRIEEAALKNVSPDNIRTVALKAASLDDSKVKSSGQPPERWISPTLLRIQVKFSVGGKNVIVPIEVVLAEGEATARSIGGSKKGAK